MCSAENNNLIYMDHAATTFMYDEAVNVMVPFFTEKIGNPAAVYRYAGEAGRAVSEARRIIAGTLNADPSEIIFTSGGTESDNMAVKSAKNHIITTAIEHHAVLESCRAMEARGIEVTYVRPGSDGVIDPEEVRAAIRPETSLISVMFANNETGTVEPVREIGYIAKEYGIIFHTDAVQAYGHLPVDVREMNIDMLSASAHKFGGPKGIGFIYVRNGLKPETFIHGGPQERGMRAGTLNVPGIAGMGEAARISVKDMQHNADHVRSLRDRMIDGVLSNIPDVRLNGHPEKRLPGNVNFSIKGIEGETLLILLDREHICASSGSACSTGALEPSHVLTAMGLDAREAAGSLRLTLAASNTAEEVDTVIRVLKTIVERLRSVRSV
ncbi:MAG: cysteine desulfurase [Lachnospiraceae bacterium]|nr:cysteine desulfurase [Lachnospiraceae bacterium]